MRYYMRRNFRRNFGALGQDEGEAESGGLNDEAGTEAVEQASLAPVAHIDFYPDGSIVTVGTEAVAWRAVQVPKWYKLVAFIGIPVGVVAGLYVGKRYLKR